MLYILWKYEVLLPNWCKYHGNLKFCIQNAVNAMEMKDSRSGSRGPYHWGGYGTGERVHILLYALVIPISHMKHVAGGSFNFRILCNGKIAIFSRWLLRSLGASGLLKAKSSPQSHLHLESFSGSPGKLLLSPAGQENSLYKICQPLTLLYITFPAGHPNSKSASTQSSMGSLKSTPPVYFVSLRSQDRIFPLVGTFTKFSCRWGHFS